MNIYIAWADPEGGQGPDPPGIARLLIFAMLKFSVRPLLGIWTRYSYIAKGTFLSRKERSFHERNIFTRKEDFVLDFRTHWL